MESMFIPQNTYGFEFICLIYIGDYLILSNFALFYSTGDILL